MPSVFSVDRNSMSCSVSWGTMGAPGPDPVTLPEMGLERVNFAIIVFGLSVDRVRLDGNRLLQTGKARSITTVDEKIVENAVYDFTVEAVDGEAVDAGPADGDSFSLTLHGGGPDVRRPYLCARIGRGWCPGTSSFARSAAESLISGAISFVTLRPASAAALAGAVSPSLLDFEPLPAFFPARGFQFPQIGHIFPARVGACYPNLDHNIKTPQR